MEKAQTPAASPWRPLTYATFRWLWLASIASNIGGWMHEVGAGWLMTSLSPSPLHVSMIQVAGSLPMFFLALPAGALADIIDKRRYLLAVQLWMALVALALAIMTVSGLIGVTSLLFLTLCLGIGTALMMPAWTALTPELVGREDLSSAIVLSGVGVNVSRAIGPAIAGILVSMAGPWLTFALNAVSFFGVIVVLLLWKREKQESVLPAERLFGAIRVGWRYARSSRALQAVLLRAIAFFLFASAGMSMLPLIVRGQLHGSAGQYGLLLACVGIGAIVGAVLLPKIREKISSDRLVAGASLVYALYIVALAFIPNVYALVPFMLLSGTAWISVLSSLQVAAQTSVPGWVRARALAVYVLVFFGGMAAGGFLWGSIATHASIPLALVLAAAGLVAGVVLTRNISLPVTDTEDLAPSLHWPTPLLDADMDQDSGPVVVTVEYDIAPENAEAFQQCMREQERERRGNGALSWMLVQDGGNPRQWLEVFIDESWLEHLRHHRRVTRGELKVESAARSYQTPGVEIRIRHFLKNRKASAHSASPDDAVAG